MLCFYRLLDCKAFLKLKIVKYFKTCKPCKANSEVNSSKSLRILNIDCSHKIFKLLTVAQKIKKTSIK